MRSGYELMGTTYGAGGIEETPRLLRRESGGIHRGRDTRTVVGAVLKEQ